MESTSKIIITFAVLLTGLVHITVGTPDKEVVLNDFKIFAEKVETALKDPHESIFSWIYKEARERLITDLRRTSFAFKSRCALYRDRTDILNALRTDVIDVFFDRLESSIGTEARLNLSLSYIKQMDPIGFMAYLAKKKVDENSGSEKVKKCRADYLEIMEPELKAFREKLLTTSQGNNPGSSASR